LGQIKVLAGITLYRYSKYHT